MQLFDNLIVIRQAILLALSVLFFMFGYMAVDSRLRYMITVMPLVIVVSVVGVDHLIRAIIDGKQPRPFIDEKT